MRRRLAQVIVVPVDDVIDDERWAAVLARDGQADGALFYGVVTTGIYCRPSCPARRPKREHVRFFTSPAEAEAAGLRPCRRCTPDGLDAGQRRAELVAAACRAIEAAPEPLALAELGAAVGASPHHLHRLFKAETGITPKAYADAVRSGRAHQALAAGSPVIDAAYAAGYGSSGRFYASADARLGMTPSQLRAGGLDVEVRFAVGASSLGAILVAASAKGVCAIDLGDDPAALVRELQDRFHAAELVGDDEVFGALVAQAVAVVEGEAPAGALPLDVRGTAFQQRVWEVLRQVPVGTTVTYTELAERVGAPAAVRAVAGACAANRLAVAIPCHRVVRRDGELSGYRWGVERKQALLEREGAR